MSEYIETIMVQPGVRSKIDYNALANKPQSDTTLTISGSFADAHTVGVRFSTVLSSIGKNAVSIQNIVDNDISSLKSTDQTILSELETINSQISTINTNLSDLTRRIAELEKLPDRVTKLEELPNRVTELEKLPTRVTSLEALPAKINKLENDMATSNTNYSNLVKEVEVLKNEVNALKPSQPTV